MAIPAKLKGAVLVIGSGVTGAFLFGGSSLLLTILIAALVQGIPWMGLVFFAPFWTTERISKFFILAAFVGFIVGIIKRNSKLIKTWMTSAFIIGIPLLGGLWMLDKCVSLVSTPCHKKLADFTNGVAAVRLQMPKGHDYHLYLTLTESLSANETNLPYIFSGNISITTGTILVTNFPFHLDKSALSGSTAVLTGVSGWNTNLPPLGQLVQAQKEYDVQIVLNPAPPPSTSLWLFWMQNRRDLAK